jgi:hypothetical protein
MNQMVAVRRFQPADTPAAVAIIRGLPDYFTSDVPEKLERDAAARNPPHPLAGEDRPPSRG